MFSKNQIFFLGYLFGSSSLLGVSGLLHIYAETSKSYTPTEYAWEVLYRSFHGPSVLPMSILGFSLKFLGSVIEKFEK